MHNKYKILSVSIWIICKIINLIIYCLIIYNMNKTCDFYINKFTKQTINLLPMVRAIFSDLKNVQYIAKKFDKYNINTLKEKT